MEELLKRDLQMDGLYDSNHLCFTLSQYDRDYDVPNYLRQNKALFKALQPEEIRCRDFRKDIRERETRLKEIEESIDENAAQMKAIDDEIKDLQSEHRAAPSTKLKRKRDQYDGSTSR
jgi:septal ring factor EnvC (AmiA/AmiB activator)